MAIQVVRSEDVKHLLQVNALRKGAGETASLKLNGYFDDVPHRTALATR
jgi:hypothetical protein